jgi:signal peptide peptidase SppA
MKITVFDLAIKQLWAILDQETLEGYLKMATGEYEVDLEAVEAEQARRLENSQVATTRDGIAIIPIVGPIFRRANLLTRHSGATSIDATALDLRVARDDPKIRGILLNVDSPGGTVNGTNELSKMVKEVAGQKPLVAYVSSTGASGAFWIASAANQIFADETAEMGSIGVIGVFKDTTKRDRARGIEQHTFVSNQSPLKLVSVDTDEGRADIQRRVDKAAEIFIGSVAANRGVLPATVIRNFGRGGVLAGEEAVQAGMIDGISTFENVLARLHDHAIGGDRRRIKPNGRRGSRAMTDKVSAADVAEDHPDAAKALRDEGAKSARDGALAEGKAAGLAEGDKAGRLAGKAEGLAEGALAERTRIAGLEAMALPGYEDLLKAAIEDPTQEGADLAKAIVERQRSSGKAQLAAATADDAALKKVLPTPAEAAAATTAEDGATGKTAEEIAGDIKKLVKQAADRGETLSAAMAMHEIEKGTAAA